MTTASSAFAAKDKVTTPFPQAPVRRVVNSSVHTWRPKILERLAVLMQLPENWNGYGAQPVSAHHAEFALSMIATACPPDANAPQIVPGENGDLQVEWHSLEYDIELHVRAPLVVSAVRHTQHGCEEIELTNDFNIVYEWLAQMEAAIAARAAAA